MKERTSAKRAEKSEATVDNGEEKVPAKEREVISILRQYLANGNPFVILSDEEVREAEVEDEVGAASGNILQALFDDDDKAGGSSGRKQHHHNVVVTQSSLKGLSNCLGQYMQMMFVVKGSSAKIFDDLTQLFDFYICSVFAGFVPEVCSIARSCS